MGGRKWPAHLTAGVVAVVAVVVSGLLQHEIVRRCCPRAADVDPPRPSWLPPP